MFSVNIKAGDSICRAFSKLSAYHFRNLFPPNLQLAGLADANCSPLQKMRWHALFLQICIQSSTFFVLRGILSSGCSLFPALSCKPRTIRLDDVGCFQSMLKREARCGKNLQWLQMY